MREAANIIGKIIFGIATRSDRERLAHLNDMHAKSLTLPRRKHLVETWKKKRSTT